MRVIGLDLAGSEKRMTGFCSMSESMSCQTTVLYGDDEILEATRDVTPGVVSIDAPLFLPKGRESLEHKGPPHLRACDRELLRMKIRFFPLTLGPMRMLTARGMRLRKTLEGDGLAVVESFPGAIQDMLGMPRKQAGLERLRSALIDYGITGDVTKQDVSDHELDAICCALVGKMYLEGDYTAIGIEEEGFMILPRSKGDGSATRVTG